MKEKKEKINAELVEKLEKLKEEIKKTGEKTAAEIDKTMLEIGKDWEYLMKDFNEFFKDAVSKEQVKDTIAKTKSWLSETIKNVAGSLLNMEKELSELHETGNDAPAGKYECIRCGRTFEHNGGPLPHCKLCGGTTFKKL